MTSPTTTRPIQSASLTRWVQAAVEDAGMPPGLVPVVTGRGAGLGLPTIENSDFLMVTGSIAERGYRVAAWLEAVNVNDASAAAWGSMDAPMGGMKASGLGRRHGEHGIVKYTESQTIATDRRLPVGAPDGMNPRIYAQVASLTLRLLKRVPWLK